MVTGDGVWNMEAFKERLSKEVVKRIANIPPPHPLAGCDKIFWIHTTNGGFSIKSAYHMLKVDTWAAKAKWKSV